MTYAKEVTATVRELVLLKYESEARTRRQGIVWPRVIVDIIPKKVLGNSNKLSVQLAKQILYVIKMKQIQQN